VIFTLLLFADKIIMNKQKRTESLMPSGIPKYVRCYDNGGETADRYTVVFTGNYRKVREMDEFAHIGMSENPYAPQGVGQHGFSQQQIDVNKWGYAPAIGRKNHLGRRIHFNSLPEKCKDLVMNDYKIIWRLKDDNSATKTED
jgi:hypothetical protein